MDVKKELIMSEERVGEGEKEIEKLLIGKSRGIGRERDMRLERIGKLELRELNIEIREKDKKNFCIKYYLMRKRGRRRLVDKEKGSEELKSERRVDKVRIIEGNSMGEEMGWKRSRIEKESEKEEIEIKERKRSIEDDGREIRSEIEDEEKFEKNENESEDREEIKDRRKSMIDKRKEEEMDVGKILVSERKDKKLEIVGMDDIGMESVRNEKEGENRIERIRKKRM